MMTPSRDRAIGFKVLLEGFVKFNLILFGVCLVLFYIRRLEVQDYFYFMKDQILLVIIASVFAKFYERFKYGIRFKELSAYKISIFFGSLFAIIVLYAYALIFKHLPLRLEAFYLFLYHVALALTYWVVVIILSRSYFMMKTIAFLKTCINYKDLFRLFVIFNIVFFIIVLVVLITASKNRNILETIFIILYFEISFLVFHVVVAHLVDLVWLPENKKTNNASLFGMCLGSVLYVLKLNIIDRKLIGLLGVYDKLLLTAIVSLILLWVFFTLLFHLEWKHLLKKKL